MLSAPNVSVCMWKFSYSLKLLQVKNWIQVGDPSGTQANLTPILCSLGRKEFNWAPPRLGHTPQYRFWWPDTLRRQGEWLGIEQRGWGGDPHFPQRVGKCIRQAWEEPRLQPKLTQASHIWFGQNVWPLKLLALRGICLHLAHQLKKGTWQISYFWTMTRLEKCSLVVVQFSKQHCSLPVSCFILLSKSQPWIVTKTLYYATCVWGGGVLSGWCMQSYS